jgi:cyclomaltodextrinase / maltogenic alpha-amylase / neopullulanase
VAAETDPPGWIRDAIVYQIFPDRFASSPRLPKPAHLEAWDAAPTRLGFKGGDLLGIVEHFDYLAELGINTISLNPIFASAANHRYHTYDYLHVDPLLGGDEALRELLDAAHDRGLRIILDGVFNHVGRGFWPFHHVLENGAASPYANWFILNPRWLASGRPLRAYPGASNHESIPTELAVVEGAGRASLSQFGYRAWWDLPALPKLNTDNPKVREFLMGVGEHWMRFGADGWRLDVAAEIETPGFWEEFRQRVRAINPEAYIVAEVWDERADLLDGHSFDGLMNYPLLTAIVGFAAGASLDRGAAGRHSWLGRNLVPLDGPGFAGHLDRLMGEYRPAARAAMLNLIGSHDTPRVLTLSGDDPAAVRLALLAQMTLPGVPSIYYGDEVGLRGGIDPGSRGAFPWDPGSWDQEMLAYTRAVVAARREMPVLRDGEVRVLGAAGPMAAYLRSWPAGEPPDADGAPAVLVALNNGASAASLELEDPELARARWRTVSQPGTADAPETEADERGRLTLRVAARSGTMLRRL